MAKRKAKPGDWVTISVLIPAKLDRWLRLRAAHQLTSRSQAIRAILAAEAAKGAK